MTDQEPKATASGLTTLTPGDAAPGRLSRQPVVTVISFGYDHGAPPHAHITFDVRAHFGRVDVAPGLVGLTAEDYRVADAWMALGEIRGLVRNIEGVALQYVARADVIVAVGCQDGRQLSPVIAGEVSRLVGYEGHPVTVYDRDINRLAPCRNPESTRCAP